MRPAEYHFLNPRGVNSDAFNPVGRHCALYDGMFFQRLQLLRRLPRIKLLLAEMLSQIGKIPCGTLRYRLRCRFKKQKRLHILLSSANSGKFRTDRFDFLDAVFVSVCGSDSAVSASTGKLTIFRL